MGVDSNSDAFDLLITVDSTPLTYNGVTVSYSSPGAASYPQVKPLKDRLRKAVDSFHAVVPPIHIHEHGPLHTAPLLLPLSLHRLSS